MSNAPIRVDSRAWTGDPAIPPAEYEVLSRKSRARDKRKTVWFLTLLAALAGMLIWLPIELAVWSISGRPPYFAPGIDSSALLIGIASGSGVAALLLLMGRRKLLPLVPLPAIMGVGLAGSVHYIKALRAEGSVEAITFYIHSLDLRHRGRSLHMRRFRASADLIDRSGRRWTLNGRYAYISQLEGKGCLTVAVRNAGAYRFPAGPLSSIETPYSDSITRKRHPDRCFAKPPPLPAK